MRYFPVFESDDEFVQYMRDTINLDLSQQPLDGPNWFCIVVRDSYTGDIAAGLACEFKTAFEVHFSASISHPAAISRKLLQVIFGTLFSRVVRITALVDPNDEHAINVTKRLGFVYEGFLRMGLDGFRDAMLFGMLIQDCKYMPGVRAVRSINGGGPNGQSTETARSLRHRVGATGG